MDAAIMKQLDFLKEITRCGGEDDFQTDITPVRKIMNRYLPDILTDNSELYLRLKAEYTRLKEFAAYRELAKKNIVTLCGKTSGGKSSFFNSLYNGGIFPVDTDRNSTVPVYAVCGTSKYIYGINNYDHFIRMNADDMKTVFSGMESENPDIPLPLGHLFSSMLTFASAPELKHIAFMDTPGYTHPDDTNFSSGNSTANLINRLNGSNYILWFADINIINLGISDSDISYLKKLDSSVPKLIIISKADVFSQKDFPEIIEKTKKILNARGISYIDVLAYSKQHPEKYDKYKILAYLDRWDKNPSIINFSQKFENIFDLYPSNQITAEFKAALLPEIQKVSSSIYNIQNAFDSQSSEKSENFVSVETIQKPVNPLKNIDLSRVKLTDLPIPNPEKLFRNYNDRNKTDLSAYERYINSVSLTLTETMKDIKPVFSAAARNNEYKKQICEVIAGLFNVSMTETTSSDTETSAETVKTEERASGRRSKTQRSRRTAAAEQPKEAPASEEQNSAETPSRRERPAAGSSRRRFR